MTDPLAKKYFLYGVGGGAAVLAIGGIFILGVFFGPKMQARLLGNATETISPSVNETIPVSDVDTQVAELAEAVLPSEGVMLPVRWGNLGKQMVEKGVIDRDRFIALSADRLGFGSNEQAMLDGENNGNIVMTPDNAGVILNLLWALGLGNKNSILDKGPMVDPRYGGAGKFASTGGWSLSKGNAMDHYSKHTFITLTKEQQELVERISQNIYRPCCNNSTYFPDCNHGMAMLALLELMASQGVSEIEMYTVALQVNAYWFPDTYLTLASYEAKNNTSWENVDPKKMLSAEYSSASGYRAIQSQVQPIQQGGGNGCGV